MTSSPNPNARSTAQLHHLATLLRDHCLEQADTAYQNARFDGLCADGAWEVAMDTLRTIDLKPLVQTALQKTASDFSPSK